MRLQPSSKLSSTDGWPAEMKKKTVPDSWSSKTEASSAELCPGSRDEHVTAMGLGGKRTEEVASVHSQ